MRVITTAKPMMDFAEDVKSNGKSIGFVPTMGALHQGHLSLIKAAKEENEAVVVSVFVNPTQFNNATDLEKYPRTFDEDKRLLEQAGVDIMFFPSVSEIYPNEMGNTPVFDLDGLDSTMEGPNRPGHFNGVVQVVMRLFDLVRPSAAFFGEKDFQQLAIIKHMTRKLRYDVNIVGCPTVRESDGLAMSSRNVRLTDNGRKLAPVIFNTLNQLQSEMQNNSSSSAISKAENKLSSNSDIKLEYLELVNPQTLQPATDDSEAIQACIAAWIDDVRLIDNMRVK